MSLSQLQLQALLILPLICVLALLMSTPIFLHTHLHVPLIDGADSGEAAAAAASPVAGERSGEDDDDYEPHPAVDYWSHLVFCIEDWNYGGEITSHGDTCTSTASVGNFKP